MKDSHKLIKKIKKILNKLSKKKEIFLYVLFSFLSIILLVLVFVDIYLKGYDAYNKIIDYPIAFTPSDYPLVSTKIPVHISAKAAVVMDNDSKVVLYERNQSLLFSMASKTKIMTALVGLDHYKMNDFLSIKTEGVGGIN